MEHEIGSPEQWSSAIEAALGKLWGTLDAETQSACRGAYVAAFAEQRVKRLKADKTTTVQTLIFLRDKFADVGAAAKWITDHGFTEMKEPDATDTSFRFRQMPPEQFASDSMRTIDITDGVKAVVGRLKKSLDGMVRKEHVVDIFKIDEQNRIVYGVVLDPYVVDSQDDHMTPRDVEATANTYMESYRSIGLLHVVKTNDCVPIQSWLVPYPSRDDYAKAMSGQPHRILMMPFGDAEVASGSWILGTKINNEELWQKVQGGELNAYSIGGFGTREPMTSEQMPVVTVRLRMAT